MRRLLTFVAGIVCCSCSSFENSIENHNQEIRLDLLERWALRSEFARLEATPLGRKMASQEGALTITIEPEQLFPDMIVSDIQAWLVPHDESWVFVREVLSRREQWEPLSAPLIRHCQVGRRDPIVFSGVPDGLYDIIAVFKGSRHDPSRGARTRRHALAKVQGEAWTCSEFQSVFSTDFKFDHVSTSPQSSSPPGD